MLTIAARLRRLITGRCIIIMICIVIVLMAVCVAVGMCGVIERIAKRVRNNICRIKSEHYGKHECESSAHVANYTISLDRL